MDLPVAVIDGLVMSLGARKGGQGQMVLLVDGSVMVSRDFLLFNERHSCLAVEWRIPDQILAWN